MKTDDTADGPGKLSKCLGCNPDAVAYGLEIRKDPESKGKLNRRGEMLVGLTGEKILQIVQPT